LVRLHMPPETDDCVLHELRQQLFGRHPVDEA
jgi:hypothetical protein